MVALIYALTPLQIIVITVILVLCVFALGWYTAKLYFKKYDDILLGHDAEVIEWSDKSKRVRVFGEIWNAEGDPRLKLKQGDTVKVIGMGELKLFVAKDD